MMDALPMDREARAAGEFNGLRLSSVYQPVVSLAHRRTVGHEALVRAHTAAGQPVLVPEVFAMAQGQAGITALDRQCRALHVGNYRARGPQTGWLFLNVNPAVVVHGKAYGAYFAGLLRRHDLPAQRIVVEILEGAIPDEAQLAEAVNYYRELGCLVAIDDFGAGHSNFERIWRLSPDIVKLDRSVIVQATRNPRARRLLPGLVSLLHEVGCLVLTEGVETEHEALIAMDADADFVQGYYFGRPAPDISAAPAGACRMGELCEQFKHTARGEAERWDASIAPHVTRLQRSVTAMELGLSLESACAWLIAEPGVVRCYLLDAEGAQIGRNLVSPALAAEADPRFAPLEDATGARWFRRPYFRRAIAKPGQVRVSRPYLSVTGRHMCVTLSIAIPSPDGSRVLCCDLDAEALEGR